MRRRSRIALAVAGIGVAGGRGGVARPRSGRWFAAMAAPTETAVTAPAAAGGDGGDRPAGQRRAGAPARRDDPRPHRDRPRLPGRRQAPRTRPAEVGAEVAAGDVVATLDDTDLRLQLEAAEAARSAARIALEKGEIDLDRVTTLEQKGWASDQATDARTVDVEELRARLLQAERSVELARERALLCDAARRRRRRGDRDLCRGRAGAGARPAGGADRPRAATARRWCRCPRRWSARSARRGAEVELWSEPGPALSRWSCASCRRWPTPPPAPTRRASPCPPTPAPALGMSATVTLAPAAGQPTVVLPTSALIDTGSGPSVWVVGADDRLEARPVVVGGLRRRVGADRARGSPAASGWWCSARTGCRPASRCGRWRRRAERCAASTSRASRSATRR